MVVSVTSIYTTKSKQTEKRLILVVRLTFDHSIEYSYINGSITMAGLTSIHEKENLTT